MRGDHQARNLLLEHILANNQIALGAAATLSDFLLGSAQLRWGDPAVFLDYLRDVTGEDDQPRSRHDTGTHTRAGDGEPLRG